MWGAWILRKVHHVLLNKYSVHEILFTLVCTLTCFSLF